jgi:anti-repressor protein
MASNTSIPIENLAKILRQNGIDTGEKRFFEWMRMKRYLTKRKSKATSLPTQRSIEMGLLETKWTPYYMRDVFFN